jgi:antitoxin HicB
MASSTIEQRVEELMNQRYRRELFRGEEGTWIGRAPELPGCITEGETQSEALEMLEDAMRSWFEVAIEKRKSIPIPRAEDEEYSGKFNLRVPRSLHRKLVEQASSERSSLNEYCVYLLSEASGVR